MPAPATTALSMKVRSSAALVHSLLSGAQSRIDRASRYARACDSGRRPVFENETTKGKRFLGV